MARRTHARIGTDMADEKSIRALDGPTWVYTARCDHGAVLYVGIALDVRRRILQHRRTKSWWKDVWAVEAALFPTRTIAAEVERRTISLHEPIWNDVGCRLQPHEQAHDLMGIEPTETRAFSPDGIDALTLLRRARESREVHG